MTGLARPRRLVAGDRVAVIAPAGPIDLDPADPGFALYRSWGLDPVVFPHVADRRGYLAGDDRDRLADLNAAWRDPGVAGIVAVRGGYGSQRIVDGLDFSAIRRHPKVFIGFSDITALHLALGHRAGIVTFHGPGFRWTDRTGPGSAESLRRAVMASGPLGELRQPDGLPAAEALVPGSAEGIMAGGNLSLICASVGTPDQPDLSGSVVLFEDVNVRPYQIDRMLTQLLRAGMLEEVAGIVFGETEPPPGADAVLQREVIGERLGSLGVPVLYGFAAGHGREQLTLPLGVLAVLDADRGTLAFPEAATVN